AAGRARLLVAPGRPVGRRRPARRRGDPGGRERRGPASRPGAHRAVPRRGRDPHPLRRGRRRPRHAVPDQPEGEHLPACAVARGRRGWAGRGGPARARAGDRVGARAGDHAAGAAGGRPRAGPDARPARHPGRPRRGRHESPARTSDAPADTASATEALADLRALVAAAAAAGRTLPAAGEVPDGVADLLAQVVSAGAPGEEPVVERIIEIRQALAAIGASTSIAAPALLDEDELDVVDLLRADLSADGSPGARAVAVAALQGPIETVADRLAALAQQPLPDGERVRVAGGISVDITSGGPVGGGWRARLADRVAAMHPTEPYLGSRMIGGGVVAVLALVLGVTSGPGWLLVLVPALGMAGHAAWQWQSSRERRESAVRHALTQAEATIADRTARLAGDLVSLRQRVDRVPADLHEVRTTLPVVV